MERNVKISLEKAREWYNSGNESLKEVALQAFKESELIVNPWEKIKTFEDACRTFIYHGINPGDADLIDDPYLRNIYKLQIIRKALNGVDWEPKFNTGTIWYPWLRYYPKGISYSASCVPIANFKFKEDNKIYTLVRWGYYYSNNGLSNYRLASGGVNAELGLIGCKSKEIAEYFSITFGKLIFDVIYGQYNNYEWISN